MIIRISVFFFKKNNYSFLITCSFIRKQISVFNNHDIKQLSLEKDLLSYFVKYNTIYFRKYLREIIQRNNNSHISYQILLNQ